MCFDSKGGTGPVEMVSSSFHNPPRLITLPPSPYSIFVKAAKEAERLKDGELEELPKQEMTFDYVVVVSSP